jgi:hypothetical protein
MSERKILWLMSAGCLFLAIVCGFLFGVTDFSVGWMFATVVFLMGAFMSFLVGCVAD